MARRIGSLVPAFVSVMACVGKGGGSEERRPGPPAEATADVPSTPKAARPEFVPAAPGDVADGVRRLLEASRGRQLVVYVGADWCEPCQAFHHAVEGGELDDALAGVRFVEFDADRDGERLRNAGYGGRYIPRFVVPDASGRASDRRMEGGIKGSGAVEHIMGRLGPVLASAGDR